MTQMCRNDANAFFEAILRVRPDFIARVVPEEAAGVYMLRTEYQHLEVQQWPPSICLRKLLQTFVFAFLRHLFVLPRLRGLHRFTWFLTMDTVGLAPEHWPLAQQLPTCLLYAMCQHTRSTCWERATVFSASPQLHLREERQHRQDLPTHYASDLNLESLSELEGYTKHTLCPESSKQHNIE